MHSSVEKLQKFFKLEAERGYDNRAVVGGFEKILPFWEKEARADHLDEDAIQSVLRALSNYSAQEPAERADTLTQLLHSLTQSLAEKPPAPERQTAAFEKTPVRQPTPKPVQQASPPPQEDQPRKINPPRPNRQAENHPLAHSQTAQAPNPVVQPPAQPRPTESAKVYPPADPDGLKAPLRVLSGVGPTMAQSLASLGLYTLEDMLYNFPRRYDDYSQLKSINRLTYGEVTTILGTIQSVFSRPVRNGKMQLTEAVINDGTGSLRVNWFNQKWLANKLTQGTPVVLAGKVEQYLGRPTMTNPEVEPLEAEHLHTNRIVPVYALTAGVGQKNLRKLIYQTVSYWALRTLDYLPAHVRSAVKLIDLQTALQNIHFPESNDLLDMARWRLAFDEIFLLQMGVLRQKRAWQTAAGQVFDTPAEWLAEQITLLPFDLTGAQTRVIEEIRRDLASGHPMDRLIQGDVGSGKTVVAALAIAMVTRGGAQAAVMAPTGILAEQHYRTFSRLLAQPTADGVSVLRPQEIRLLTGDTSETERQEIYRGLLDGSIKVLIGTHALIESPVQFQRLQFAVVDEQHRFGVAQRGALRSKGENPHLLVMTATPIPRSLALTVYGDLDLSVMDEMPAGRQPIETHVLRPVERERAYQIIEAQVEEGHQAFIVYPQVEQNHEPTSAEGEAEDDEEILSQAEQAEQAAQAAMLTAVEEHVRLQRQIFPKMRLGLLHGRMKPEEKDAVMKQFRDHQLDILVSTTVVEVGVDIPNATVMLIEGANRFGLAQLHQLRGRVGRGSVGSYCLLIPDKENAMENERLAVMVQTNDGFVLADHDLQQRGPGEFLGTRQAGFSELKMANLTDVRLIEKARQQAQVIFQEDPDLLSTENQPLARKLAEFWDAGRGDVS